MMWYIGNEGVCANSRCFPGGLWGMMTSLHWGSGTPRSTGILPCVEPFPELVYSCGTDHCIWQTVPLSDYLDREKVFTLSAVGGCLAQEAPLVSPYSLSWSRLRKRATVWGRSNPVNAVEDLWSEKEKFGVSRKDSCSDIENSHLDFLNKYIPWKLF